jgi:hypothetical protein
MTLAHFTVKVETIFAMRLRRNRNTRVPHNTGSILARCLSGYGDGLPQLRAEHAEPCCLFAYWSSPIAVFPPPLPPFFPITRSNDLV